MEKVPLIWTVLIFPLHDGTFNRKYLHSMLRVELHV